jgi:hypothetical protein
MPSVISLPRSAISSTAGSIMKDKHVPDLPMIEYIMHANQKKGLHKIYLFLDFDGVINVFYQEGTEAYKKKIKESGNSFDFADRKAVERLNRFCEDYPVQVIISSSWRFGRLKGCTAYLKQAGLKDEKIIADTTQTASYQEREADIEQYLLAHPDFSGFLIFDDMDMPHFEDYLVQTDPFKGWNAERDRAARRIVKKF